MEDLFEAARAAQRPKHPGGRPPKNRQPQTPHSDPYSIIGLITPHIGNDIEDIYVVLNQLEDAFKAVDIDSKLTPQELKYIDSRFRAGMDMKSALKSAGYIRPEGDTYYVRIARRIEGKYEAHEQDKAQIMRILGAGEIAVIQGMINEARTSRSSAARVTAWQTLGKWLGLAKEQMPTGGGVTVIIQALGDAQVQVNQEQAPAQVEQQQPYSTRPQPTGRPVYVTK